MFNFICPRNHLCCTWGQFIAPVANIRNELGALVPGERDCRNPNFLSRWTPLSFYWWNWGPWCSKRDQICSTDVHMRRTWTPQAPRAQAGSRVKQTELARWKWGLEGSILSLPTGVGTGTHITAVFGAGVIPKHSSLGLIEISWRPALAHRKAHYQEIRVYSVYLVSYENTR